jgi:hypothetical protein
MENHVDEDASVGNFLIRPPELSGNPTSRDMWEKVGEMDGVRILLISICDTSTDL